MMPRHRLVEAEGLAIVERARLRLVDVDVEDRGRRASVRRRLVEGGHVRGGAIRLDGPGDDRQRLWIAESLRERRRRALERCLVPGEQLLGGALELIGTLGQLRAERRDARLRFGLRNRLHLLLDRGEEADSEVVDLLRGALSA